MIDFLGIFGIILELRAHDVQVAHKNFFDTVMAKPKNMTDFRVRCEEQQINVRHFEDGFVGISVDETTLGNQIGHSIETE